MPNKVNDIPSALRIQRLIKKILVVLFTIPTFYLVMYGLYRPKGISISLLSLFLLLPFLILILNHYKKLIASKFIGLIGYNIALFLVASSEPTATGVYLHFVSCSAVSIVLFPYSHRWKSFLFIAFSVSLVLVTHQFTINIIPFREISTESTKILFIIHTIGAALISSLCIYMLLGSNYNSRMRLIESKELVEKANLELLKINDELDRFVYSASHDLKAPLSTIQGLANLMEKDKETPSQEFILKIKGQTERMEKFIDDIVTYSRNSRTELRLEWINICQLINDLQQSYAYFENANKIAFDNCIQANEVVYSDQYRLQVVLNNIISNAFKYSDMSKNNPFIKISCLNNCGHQIIIEDNGKGIEKEYLPKIFDMFYRASTGSNGSGLGLYIAMESARNINCRLEVESEYGNGTLFKINLPEYVSA